MRVDNRRYLPFLFIDSISFGSLSPIISWTVPSVTSAGKDTSCMDKFGSVIDRLNMKLGSKFLDSLKIKT